MDQAVSTDAVKKERDEWVRAIDRLCLEWKRRSQAESENVYEVVRAPADGGAGGEEDRDRGRARAEDVKEPVTAGGPNDDGPLSSPPPPLPLPLSVPKSPGPVPSFAMVPQPPPPPPPPPLMALPMVPPKSKTRPLSKRTKAFHWDVVSQDKVILLLLILLPLLLSNLLIKIHNSHTDNSGPNSPYPVPCMRGPYILAKA